MVMYTEATSLLFLYTRCENKKELMEIIGIAVY